jgi:hypothetical protein
MLQGAYVEILNQHVLVINGCLRSLVVLGCSSLPTVERKSRSQVEAADVPVLCTGGAVIQGGKKSNFARGSTASLLMSQPEYPLPS